MNNQHQEVEAETIFASVLEQLQRSQRASAPTVRNLRRAMAQLPQCEVIAASGYIKQQEPALLRAGCLPA